MEDNQLIVLDENKKFIDIIENVREDIRDNPYIEETIRVLSVEGYRSAIGCFWNAVVDDLRSKILYRSINLFNKEMKPKKEIKTYEDFQDNVNDEMLLDGAYKIGIIGWEAHKVLKQAKDTRNIFDGHPRSSNPTAIKALSLIEDCIKYVLSQEYPPQIIDIDEYIHLMERSEFDRNEYVVSDALSDLPDIYKDELINRLLVAYIDDMCSTIMRANIEFVVPILWKVLRKETILQVVKTMEKEILKGNLITNQYVVSFIDIVSGIRYLSTNTKKYLLAPIIDRLNQNLDTFAIENECIARLYNYAGYIPRELLYNYVNGLTQTYIGKIGGSMQFSRTDFYADGAAVKIPTMFKKFDDESAFEFIKVIKNNSTIKGRITNHVKLNRLRTLGKIVEERVSENFKEKDFLEILINPEKEKEFFKNISQKI